MQVFFADQITEAVGVFSGIAIMFIDGVARRGQILSQHGFLIFLHGGFKNQPQQLMFSRVFGEFHIVQELAVDLYR